MPLSSVEGQVGVNLHQEGPNVCHRGSIIPAAIGAILVLGGVFLFLASYQVLPAGANAISNLGGWGDLLGFCALGAGGISFLFALGKSQEQMIDFDAPPSQEYRAQTSHTPNSSADPQLDAVTRGLRKAQEETDEGIEILKKSPKRVSDGKTVDDISCLLEAPLKASIMSLQLNRRLATTDRKTIEDSLSIAIADFSKFHREGKSIITPVAPSANRYVQLVIDSNETATKRNLAIDAVGDALAIELAQDYPDVNNPPSEFTQMLLSTAIVELKASWKKYAKKWNAEAPKRSADGEIISFSVVFNNKREIYGTRREIVQISRLLKAESPDQERITSSLNQAIADYETHYTEKRMVIIPTEDAEDKLTKALQEINKQATEVNIGIDGIRDALAKCLAKAYPDSDAPPAQFSQESKSEALTQLEASWKEALATVLS